MEKPSSYFDWQLQFRKTKFAHKTIWKIEKIIENYLSNSLIDNSFFIDLGNMNPI